VQGKRERGWHLERFPAAGLRLIDAADVLACLRKTGDSR